MHWLTSTPCIGPNDKSHNYIWQGQTLKQDCTEYSRTHVPHEAVHLLICTSFQSIAHCFGTVLATSYAQLYMVSGKVGTAPCMAQCPKPSHSAQTCSPHKIMVDPLNHNIWVVSRLGPFMSLFWLFVVPWKGDTCSSPTISFKK